MKKVILVLSALCLLSGFTSAKTPRFVNLEFFGAYNLAGFSLDSRFSASSKFGYRAGLGYGFGYSRISGMYSSRSNSLRKLQDECRVGPSVIQILKEIVVIPPKIVPFLFLICFL